MEADGVAGEFCVFSGEGTALRFDRSDIQNTPVRSTEKSSAAAAGRGTDEQLIRVASVRGALDLSSALLETCFMKKENVNVWVNRRLAQEFRKTAKGYFNRLGMCYGAAMLMFLEADPATQGEYLKRVFHADVDDEVVELLKAAKGEQARRIAARESKPRA